MPLAPLHLLAAIIPARPADFAGLDRLAVDAARAGLWITAQAQTERFAHRRVKALPRPIAPPAAQIVVHRLPRRPFLGQEAPGSAGTHLIENGSEDGAQVLQSQLWPPLTALDVGHFGAGLMASPPSRPVQNVRGGGWRLPEQREEQSAHFGHGEWQQLRRRAHRAGVRRGRLLQAVAGHPGLSQGRATLQILGWPNLQRAQRAARADAYPALQRGRETQAARGWPGLRAIHHTLSPRGYPHLAQGRANLAARGWPNWQRAQDVLKAQDYLPLVEAQRLRTHEGAARQTDAATDRRRLRGRATRVAILEAVHAWEDQRAPDPALAGTSAVASARRVTGRALAAHLQLHPATVYAHLKRIRLLAAQEMQEMMAEGLL
jgi:hypothetical protein